MPATPAVALVTGIGGQDGIYLARHLVAQGSRVLGTVTSAASAGRLRTYVPEAEVVTCDLRDVVGMRALLEQHRPDHVYNLAALTSVGQSWADAEGTRAVNADAVAGLLDAVRATSRGRDVRFFQASSAEVRGAAAGSPYAQAKLAAESLVVAARADGLFACFATLHNHESPLRDLRFVTRKVTRAAAEIALGRREVLELGNLSVSRDWGFAGDYVEAMRLMLTGDEPHDLPVGTGVAHSLADLVEVAFDVAGVADPWSRVVQDPQLLRPVDAELIVADAGPAATVLGWRAETTFEALVAAMVRADLERLRTGVEDSPAYLGCSAS